MLHLSRLLCHPKLSPSELLLLLVRFERAQRMEAFQKQLSLPLLLFAFLLPSSSLAQSSECSPVPYECGGVKFNISYPFRTKGYPHHCSLPGTEFEIACNQTDGSSEIDIQNNKYHVQMIDYENQILTVVHKDFFGSHNGSCLVSSLENTTTQSFEFFKIYDKGVLILTFLHNCPFYLEDHPGLRLLKCVSNEITGSNAYFTLLPEIPKEFGNCREVKIPILKEYRGRLERDPDAEGAFKDALGNGFQITWYATDPQNRCWKCVQSKGHCGYDESTYNQQPICYCNGQPLSYACPTLGAIKTKRNKVKIAAGTGAGIFLITCLLVFMVCFIRKLPSDNFMFFWKKKTNDTRNVEAFLEHYGSLVPKRYHYSELKKIANSFNDKLGQGGYGSVFKGKLTDGRDVAVKVLNKSKGGNGDEFINEVASIGRTHHVNVVALLGFCSEGSKRALVYEFMPNGSLDKFIYSDKLGTRNILDCQKLLDIALGIAQGLEYLHRGCNTRILHLDIKPHNILLDDNFCPKISDFGLAKLCPGQQSTTISILDARGTVGYIAPEVFCRNIGGVSHKSDVYSYGMMVLEMIGGRKNNDERVDNTSEIYFPHWAHKHINLNGSQGSFGFRTEEEEEIARKMVMVGLWCIQTDPANRPSMSRVVEMLEGSRGRLEMPPKPYFSSPSRSFSSTT